MATSPARAAQLRYVLRFLGITAVLTALYGFPYAEQSRASRCFSAYLGAYARTAASVLAVSDASVRVSGQDIIGRYPLRIVKNCDAMETNILLAAAIFAFPCAFRWRLGAAAAGIGILVAANIVRICSLYYIGIHWESAFEFAHRELWPLILTALAVAEFVLFASWVSRRTVTVTVTDGRG